MLRVGLRAELGAHLRAYAALLPLGLHDLDRVVAREADENPWLELVDRPLLGLNDGDARIAAAGPSLVEHLESQLNGRGIHGTLLRAAQYVIGALDEHAYLRDGVATIAQLAHVGDVDAMRAIEVVQNLEPAGVAARSLGERFRLQLIEAGDDASSAFQLTFELDELASEGTAAFAARRRLAPDDVTRALARLRTCDPDPARDFRCAVDRVYPEIVIAREDDLLRASIDGRFWPDIRLVSFEVTRGLSEPMRQARTRARLLVDALARRRTTLESLALALLDRQRRYFLGDGDARELVPLTGRDLAREIGCAESTISRAVAGRYAATPFGTIPLRALLVRRPAAIGLTVATVRQHIRELAEASPNLSDDAIARSLRLRGVRLARRTVAKYRSELGLGSSRTRARP